MSFVDKPSWLQEEATAPYNPSREMARGISWAVLMRWCMRAIGLISTLILARLLTPDDFGVVAMATLVSGFIATFTDVGVAQHLIRAKTIDRAHCDTAWTIGFLQSVFISIVLAALAHPAATYFGEPRVVNVIYVVALAVFVGGFGSVGLLLARRELDFARDFRFQVYKKLLIFAATVGAALYLRSYWGLVVGLLCGTIVSVILSYVMHPYRPAWSLAKVGEYLRFGVYVLPLRLAYTLRQMAPTFIAGGLGNAATLGAFTVSNGLATLFTSEVVGPMGRGLFPNYARLAGDKQRLSAVYRQILALVCLIVIPIGAGLSAVANDTVAVILGPKWRSTVALIEFLALGASIYAVSQAMTAQILIATGRERTAAILSWIRLGITVPILLLGLQYGGIVGLAQSTIAAPLVCLPIIFMETRRAVFLPVSTFIALLWRPIVASVVMYAAIKALHPEDLDWAVLRLAWDVAVGATAYTAATLILWMSSGRPQGAERILLTLLRRRFRWFRLASTA